MVGRYFFVVMVYCGNVAMKRCGNEHPKYEPSTSSILFLGV
jgi:hypothetical protein